ncbi:MAG: flagellar basal-body MS-ring/collar protein FliF [Anaerotignaceae bacterium]
MNLKVNELIEKIKTQLSGLSPKMKKIIIVCAVAIIGGAIGISYYLNNRPYETLFTGLNQQEASEIMGLLQEMGVDYKYNTDGTILVPKEQEEQTKAQLVYQGYPNSGFTYDLFKDNIGLTTTDFEKNSYKIFELQDRIGSTIRLFSGVKDAKVIITLGEDKRYVLDQNSNQGAQASVVVIMDNGGSPSEEQVEGIQRLVAKSIPGLMDEGDVVVVDGNGNDVSGISSDSPTGANKLKLEFEKYMDDTIRNKILTVLAPIYGADNIRVSVRTVASVDKKIRELINYSVNPESNNSGIVGSESTATEVMRDGEAAGGVPGAETNADIPTYGQITADGTESYIRNEANYDYLVNQLKEQAQLDSGSIEDITVAVTINGSDLGGISQTEMLRLVGTASGIERDLYADKISVIAVPFYQPPSAETPIISDGENNWIIIGAIISGVVLLIIIAIIITIIIRKRKNKSASGVTKADVQKQLGIAASQEDALKKMFKDQQDELENQLLEITNEAEVALRKKIRYIAEENPEIAAKIIKLWLKGGESNGS